MFPWHRKELTQSMCINLFLQFLYRFLNYAESNKMFTFYIERQRTLLYTYTIGRSKNMKKIYVDKYYGATNFGKSFHSWKIPLSREREDLLEFNGLFCTTSNIFFKRFQFSLMKRFLKESVSLCKITVHGVLSSSD